MLDGLSKYLLPDENPIEKQEPFTLWNTVLKNVSRTVPAGIIFLEYLSLTGRHCIMHFIPKNQFLEP